VAAAGDYSTVDLLGSFKANGGVTQGITIARTRMVISVASAAANDPGDQFAIGIIRGQQKDVGVNVTGAPEPILDLYEDWAFWDQPTCDTNGHYYPGAATSSAWTSRRCASCLSSR